MLRIAEHGSLALQIVHFPFSMPAVNRPHPLHVLTLTRLRMLDRDAGKGGTGQVNTATALYELESFQCWLCYATMAEERAGYVL